jgi:tRNA-specific 2-thiouridylase
VGSLSWINQAVTGGRAEVQPRYRAKSETVEVTPRDDGKLELTFTRPQRALTPGQICAFYDGGRLLGGGVFESIGSGAV